MKHRLFVMIGAACLMASTYQLPVDGQAPTTAANAVGKTWTPPRTPDGQPDIQGTWTNFDNTPFEAPGPDDAARLAALRKWFPPGDQTGPGALWGSDGPASASRNARRKAMVVEPENGRVPVRPEAEAKKDAALTHLTDSWENHTPWERCITRGVPAGIFPGGYGAGYQIIQGPGVVVIVYEMIHEARIIPVDGRPHHPPEHSSMERRLARALGRQHARRRHHQLQQQELDRHEYCQSGHERHRPERAIARGRTLHGRRCEHHQLRSDDR